MNLFGLLLKFEWSARIGRGEGWEEGDGGVWLDSGIGEVTDLVGSGS